jgi:DNA-binding GntR family transcriptional regulator
MPTRMGGTRRNNGGMVYERLREAIRHGYFHPGERIIERAVANELAVSRTPVREALHRLTQEGLVVEDNGAWRVPAITEAEAEDLYDIRRLLEGRAAELAAVRRTEADLAALRQNLEQAQEAVRAHAIHELIERNQRFHQLVMQASHNVYYGEFLRILTGRTSLTMFISLSRSERPTAVVEEHQALYAAIAAGDPERAKFLAGLHTQHSLDSVKRGIRLSEERVTLLKTLS